MKQDDLEKLERNLTRLQVVLVVLMIAQSLAVVGQIVAFVQKHSIHQELTK